ncbi:MAG TPA: Gfo/Idh/MocA family oxidoreductase [Rectinemataceae bacterium]
MDTIRWGILSVSNHYRMRVHQQLEDSAMCEPLAIASRDAGKAEAEAARLGIPKAYGSYEGLLADPEIDAVYIPLPNHLHAEWVKKSAEAGKHVLCEKPFAMDAQEARQAIGYARSKGVRVMEAFMYRFHPQWTRAKQIVESGEIGKVVFVQAHFAFNNKDPKNIRNMKEAGGGAIMDIGCYAVSSARFMIGGEPKRAICLVNRDPELGIDMLSSGILDFGGAHAQFSVSTQAFAAQRIEVVGSSGKLSMQIPFNMYSDVPAELSVTTSVSARTVQCGPAGQYRRMFEAYSASLLAGRPEPTPAEDAIANMEALDALFRSERSGGWEKVGG